MVLYNRYIFLAHFGKIKKKSSERFFRKVSKTPKWRQIYRWRQYFRQNLTKTAKIDFLRVNKWFYAIDIIFWHILAKFKNNPRNSFFAKSKKPQNDVKFGILVLFLAFFCATRQKLKKVAVWRLSPYWAPTSYHWSKFRKNPWSGFRDNLLWADSRTDAHINLIL